MQSVDAVASYSYTKERPCRTLCVVATVSWGVALV